MQYYIEYCISWKWIILFLAYLIHHNFDWMLDIICKKTVEPEVSSMWVQKRLCLFFCQTISMNVVESIFHSWARFGFYCFCSYHWCSPTSRLSVMGCWCAVFSLCRGCRMSYSSVSLYHLSASSVCLHPSQCFSLGSCPSLSSKLLLRCLLLLTAAPLWRQGSFLVLLPFCVPEVKSRAFSTLRLSPSPCGSQALPNGPLTLWPQNSTWHQCMIVGMSRFPDCPGDIHVFPSDSTEWECSFLPHAL